MTLTLGDVAPDFEAQTTEGLVRFHDWIGDSWAVLFSHPKDFTPVCTTELGYMAKIKPEFDRRNVKVIMRDVSGLEGGDARALSGGRPHPDPLSATSRGRSCRWRASPTASARRP